MRGRRLNVMLKEKKRLKGKRPSIKVVITNHLEGLHRRFSIRPSVLEHLLMPPMRAIIGL